MDSCRFRSICEGCPVIFYRLLLLGFFTLSILISSSKNEIHHQHLISYNDGQQKESVIFGFMLQVIDAVQQQMTSIYDFSKKNNLYAEKLSPFGFSVAYKRIVNCSQHDLSCCQTTPRICYIEIADIVLGNLILARKSTEVENDRGDLQSIRDKECKLRPQKKNPPYSIDFPLSHNMHDEAYDHTTYTERFKKTHLISHTDIMPGQIIKYPTQSKESQLQAQNDYLYSFIHQFQLILLHIIQEFDILFFVCSHVFRILLESTSLTKRCYIIFCYFSYSRSFSSKAARKRRSMMRIKLAITMEMSRMDSSLGYPRDN